MSNNRNRFNDLLTELAGAYSDFEIVDGVIYFVDGERRTNEGQIKIIPTHCGNFKLRAYISKMRKIVFSQVLDPDVLTDPEEQAKVHGLLSEVDCLLNGQSSAS